MAAYGLYTHIAANKTRSIVLLIGLFVLVYVLVYAGALIAEVVIDGGRTVPDYLRAAAADLIQAAPLATIGAALWIVIAYFFHQKLIDAVTGGHAVTRAEQPRLYNLLENLCISRGIPMPKLKIMDSAALNAFASGLNPKQYAITVTSGLVERLDDAEIEAVLAHELTHIKNGDVQLMVIAVIIAGVVGFFGELMFRLFVQGGIRIGGGWSGGGSSSSSSSGDRKSGGGAIVVVILAIVLILLAWLLSQVVKLALSRSREFLADAGSVELTKNPDAMISALRKIENRGELEGATSAVMEMCVDNPRSGFSDLFATHPSVESRVDALVKFAGGHYLPPLPAADGDEGSNAAAPDGPVEDAAAPASPGPVHGPWSDAPAPARKRSLLRGPWGWRS
ncbi:heat shock protein [Rhodopseudomonas thermotolerans]|uniref:Protease HtpX homolog n=2 Tax=Rhodopseudomonas TaxID=1073 RepID=A0A336JLZ0_9BRAD|nr:MULTISPECIES: M48 family metallopeptidase [Rhodopseudomonas]RED36145.1 heat shock protein [Rhodopseudomonas pentothenatexigens]REG03517.1 heat shock protein [Rhodopseudomonas thermotolerans]SSW90705.1 heat shock protein [Rhodopseudomonas pentothenatexigens]